MPLKNKIKLHLCWACSDVVFVWLVLDEFLSCFICVCGTYFLLRNELELIVMSLKSGVCTFVFILNTVIEGWKSVLWWLIKFVSLCCCCWLRANMLFDVEWFGRDVHYLPHTHTFVHGQCNWCPFNNFGPNNIESSCIKNVTWLCLNYLKYCYIRIRTLCVCV
jgi:hypothetical protein